MNVLSASLVLIAVVLFAVEASGRTGRRLLSAGLFFGFFGVLVLIVDRLTIG